MVHIFQEALGNQKTVYWSEMDQRMMRRALELAARGIGLVSPSPLVGCVIATDEGQVVGEGFYLYEGVKHAEALALEQAGPLANGATAYISLEPHAHYGRTPPCTEALIRAGIKCVIYSIDDPNPLVSGSGLTQLQAAGIEVKVGLLAREATLLNEKYIHALRTGRPFVHLRQVCSLNDRAASRAAGARRWLSCEETYLRMHELRHEYDALMVGAGTAAIDDPLLTDRSGRKRRTPLVRVVLDRTLRLSPDSKLAETAQSAPLLIFTEEAEGKRTEALRQRGVEIIRTAKGCHDLRAILRELCRRSLQSVLLEGGATIARAFLNAGFIDKVSSFIASKTIGGTEDISTDGGARANYIADSVNLVSVETKHHGCDAEIIGYPVREVKEKQSIRNADWLTPMALTFSCKETISVKSACVPGNDRLGAAER